MSTPIRLWLSSTTATLVAGLLACDVNKRQQRNISWVDHWRYRWMYSLDLPKKWMRSLALMFWFTLCSGLRLQ